MEWSLSGNSGTADIIQLALWRWDFYNGSQNIPVEHIMQDEILESLSFEKKLCENLTRVEVQGKEIAKYQYYYQQMLHNLWNFWLKLEMMLEFP